MKRRTQFVTLLGLGSALLISSAAHAQGYPGGGGYPGGSSTSGGGSATMGSSSTTGGAGGANGAGAVSNTSLNSSTDTTTATTTDTAVPSTPPNTGGEPLLMSLLGSLTAGSALLLRRKVR